jgi:dienelactone hydrolase
MCWNRSSTTTCTVNPSDTLATVTSSSLRWSLPSSNVRSVAPIASHFNNEIEHNSESSRSLLPRRPAPVTTPLKGDPSWILRCCRWLACDFTSERAAVMSRSLLCCFGCLTCMGCRDRVCARLVFFPPEPFYSLEERNGVQTLWLLENGRKLEPYTAATMRVDFVHTRLNSTICTLWLRFPGSTTTTILFAHGNATDLGAMRDHLLDLSRRLRVNVMAYEYTGYGLSAGDRPTVSHTLADSEAAYDFLVRTYPAESERVILYGQSIGSGPTIHLATQRRNNGVIIHSGILSALRVIAPNVTSSSWYDIFRNVDLIPRVNSSVFVFHGSQDAEIPVQHGIGLSERAPQSFPIWIVEGAGHNNIEVDYRPSYMERLNEFVRYIEDSTAPRGELEDPLLVGASPAVRAAAQRKEQEADEQSRRLVGGGRGAGGEPHRHVAPPLRPGAAGTLAPQPPSRLKSQPAPAAAASSSVSSSAAAPFSIQSPKLHSQQERAQSQREEKFDPI